MKSFVLILGMGCVALASAQPQFGQDSSHIMTGVQDTSNLWNGVATTGYGFNVTTNASDPAYYINNIELVPGAGWNSNLTFNIADYNGSGTLGNGFSNNDYTLGTPLKQGTTYYWSNVLAHYGAFDSSIATGIYSFDAVFQGGLNSTATNTLFDAQLQVEIVKKVDVSVTPSYDQQTIGQGGTSTVSETVKNNMANRTFVSTTWFITGMGDGSGNSLSGNFVGNWFDQSIAPGDSLTGQHSTWTAAGNQAPGTYTGDTGIVGGLYNGDQLFFGNPSNTTIYVAAPEPAAMALLGMGAMAVIRRRRRA